MIVPPAEARAANMAQHATLGYHEVTEQPLTSGFVRRGAARFTLTPAAFASQLDAILAGKQLPRLVTELDPGRAGRHLLLSFDDGGRSAMHSAHELERRGWRAHFFIITSRIGERTFLAENDIRQLHAMGHVVGSHSHTHPNIIRELQPDQILREWQESTDRLEQLLGAPCQTGAVPGGHTSAAVEMAAAESGLRHLFTCTPTLRSRMVGDCRVYGRVLVRREMSTHTVANLACFRGWERQFLVRRSKDVLRSGMPWLFRAWTGRMAEEVTPGG
ncbi:MAG TPA: polysaccharide deacetylase family protein [Gemmatimonadales bacterium]|nr:polysaccharide deacetylase family protein [Gemmatimonadales bacterium]